MKQSARAVIVCILAAAFSAAAHEHHAPHKGALVEFGEEFAHLEIVLDGATGKLTAYALDGEAEKAVRIKQAEIVIAITGVKGLESITLKAQASPLSGETVGDTSEFSAQADSLKGVKQFDGAIKEIAIRGSSFKDVKFNFPKGNEDNDGSKKPEPKK